MRKDKSLCVTSPVVNGTAGSGRNPLFSVVYMFHYRTPRGTTAKITGEPVESR